MDPENLEILREAANIRQRKETAERAVGRATRRLGKDYDSYISAISELREFATRRKVDVDDALSLLLKEYEQ